MKTILIDFPKLQQIMAPGKFNDKLDSQYVLHFLGYQRRCELESYI